LAGRDLQKAVTNFKNLLEQALGCVTHERLTAPRVKQYELNSVYPIYLKDMEAVPLTGVPLSISAGERFRVVRESSGDARIQTVEYTYEILTNETPTREVLLFHWTPELEHAVVRIPHMHIGQALIERQQAIRPGSLQRAHIPTGRISLGKIIWMAIKEFGATPTHGHWENVLTKSEEDFERNRTR
jgi:hypothetical protein